MNKTVTNLSMIANAAEYFDRKTSGAWRIRSALTNMLVWSANGLIYANESQDVERIFRARTEMATLRIWGRDANTSSFELDLLPGSIRRTLGLDKQTNPHDNATNIARIKCMQARSASRFNEFYKAALAAAEEQRLVRESRVEEISNILSDECFALSEADKDFMVSFKGFDPSTLGDSIADEDLYDDESVERQRDTLNEVVGNALESMYEHCDYELVAAITSDKINRLTAYKNAIEQMLDIVGVDRKKMSARRAKLEATIADAVNKTNITAKELDNQIQGEISKLVDADKLSKSTKSTKSTKPGMRRVKQSDLAKELGAQL